MKRIAFLLALFSLVAGACFCAYADVIFEMVTIGNPGNVSDLVWEGNPETPVDDIYMGAVSYVYQISKYEVTVGQYVEFLNAKAKSDPYGLYREDMSDPGVVGGAIIQRFGAEGSYTYSAVTGKENQPVRLVDFYTCLRFCNWLHNGQGDGDTETGSYNLSLGKWLTREPGATWVLPSNDEWHKAAYYDPELEVYWEYPNGKNTIEYPTDERTPREQNFGGSMIGWQGNVYFTSIGETTGYTAYGVYDMGGNVTEWTDSLVPPGQGWSRITRGGAYNSSAEYLARLGAIPYDPTSYGDGIGFRVVYLIPIPEPSTTLLLLLGGALLYVQLEFGSYSFMRWRKTRRIRGVNRISRASCPGSGPM